MPAHRRFHRTYHGQSVIHTADKATYDILVSHNDTAVLIRKKLRENKTIEQIARDLQCSEQTVRNKIREYKIPYDRRFAPKGGGPTKQSEEVRASKSAKMKEFVKTEHQNDWTSYKRKMKAMPIERDETRVYRDVAGVKISYPKWYEEVRRRREAGETAVSLAEDYGVSASRISQIASPNWEAYQMRGKDQLKKRKPVSHYIDQINAAKQAGTYKEPAMPDRVFEVAKSNDPTDLRNAVKIVCGSCGTSNKFLKQGIISHTHAAKVFREKGWVVGGGPRADRCPSCVGGLGKHKPKEAPKEQAPLVTISNIPEEQAKGATGPAVQAHVSGLVANVMENGERKPAAFPTSAVEDERKMKREDKRLITMRLNDVYGETCYNGDWTDAKVAADMGVPVKWVAEIREDTFGPELNVNSKLAAELMAAMADLQGKLDALDAKRKDMLDKVNMLFDNEVPPLAKALSELRERVNNFTKNSS